jgi:hypothetical protein
MDMVKTNLVRQFIRPLATVFERFGIYMQQDIYLLMFFVFPAVIFLFIIWLVYRIENRAAKEAIYKNFPLFKDAVDSFQLKLDYLITRVDALEEKIIRIENKIK